jgi:hypothetical protein
MGSLSSYNFAVISLPADCRENPVAFQQYVIRLQKRRTVTSCAKYETPMYFYMMSNYTVNDNGENPWQLKHWVMTGVCNCHVSGSSTH